MTPPAKIIEPAIALSIVFVGADNLVRGDGRDLRAWVALVFGLVHGFGFANVLREFGLPTEALGWSLFSFNVGVEIGQLAIVLVVASALAAIRRRSAAPRVAGRVRRLDRRHRAQARTGSSSASSSRRIGAGRPVHALERSLAMTLAAGQRSRSADAAFQRPLARGAPRLSNQRSSATTSRSSFRPTARPRCADGRSSASRFGARPRGPRLRAAADRICSRQVADRRRQPFTRERHIVIPPEFTQAVRTS